LLGNVETLLGLMHRTSGEGAISFQATTLVRVPNGRADALPTFGCGRPSWPPSSPQPVDRLVFFAV